MTATLPLCTEALGWGHRGGPLLGSDLTLTLQPGEAVAVVGPNGVGKTTLLRTIAGVLPPRGGQAHLSGDDPWRAAPELRARRVAMLPQSPAVDLDLAVVELVELGRTAHLGAWGRPRPADRVAVARALAACALEAEAARRLGEISGGERQRAQIAMTLAQAAPLLLLDEPTSHLDLRHRHLLFELLGRLRAEEGLAMVMVLHELVDAFAECDRVLVLTGDRPLELRAPVDDRTRRRLATAFDVPVERIPPLGSG